MDLRQLSVTSACIFLLLFDNFWPRKTGYQIYQELYVPAKNLEIKVSVSMETEWTKNER